MSASSIKRIETKLKSLKPFLSEKYNVSKIGYFGSFSRDEQHENSDIDILISPNKALGWVFFDIQNLLEKELGLKVNLVSDKALKKQLRSIILKSVKYI